MPIQYWALLVNHKFTRVTTNWSLAMNQGNTKLRLNSTEHPKQFWCKPTWSGLTTNFQVAKIRTKQNHFYCLVLHSKRFRMSMKTCTIFLLESPWWLNQGDVLAVLILSTLTLIESKRLIRLIFDRDNQSLNHISCRYTHTH